MFRINVIIDRSIKSSPFNIYFDILNAGVYNSNIIVCQNNYFLRLEKSRI